MAVVKERFPFLPLQVDAFTSDELVEAMTTEEVGAYFLLICKAWKSQPPCTIPDDDKTLARWARMSERRWLACKARVLAPWKSDAPGRLFQKRLRESFDHVTLQVEKKKVAGAKGGKAKANRKTLDKPQETPSTATAQLEQRQSDATAQVEQCSSTGGSKPLAEGYQLQQQVQVSSNEDIPPNPPAEIVLSCPADESVTGIEVDGELITYDQDHIRWVPEFIRRWNLLPGVRRHEGNALSTPNLRALRERLTEHDWFWKRAFGKFPLHLPDGTWQIALGKFLEPATVSNILDGKYERRTTEAGLFPGSQKQEPGRIRTGATSDAIEQAMAEAAAKRGRPGGS